MNNGELTLAGSASEWLKGALKSPWTSPFLTMLLVVAFYYYLVATCVLIGAVIVVVVMVQITSVLRSFFKKDMVCLKNVMQTAVAVTFPILIVPNIWAIDFAGTKVLTRLMEGKLLRQMEELPVGQPRYSRFNFGSIGASRRWVIYDESDQVSCPPEARSKEWWAITKEDYEIEVACVGKARRIYSHFYIQYSACK